MRIICAFLAVSMLFAAVPTKSHAKEQVSEPEAYVLYEPKTHKILEGSNENKRLFAGYLSKLMSLLMIAEDIETGKFSLSDELTASESVSGTKGSVIWLEPGDRLSVEELLKSVITGNANDALTVLAEKSEGSIEKFVMRMNSEAFDFGLRDTAFYSPYGYYDEREYTTAHDMAVICGRLSKYDFLTPYFKTWRDFVKSGKTELVNENTLARTYEPHIGFKACHSEKSGYCIAEAGRNESGMCCIAVVLGAENSDISFSFARKLLKKGFNGFKVTSTMFPDEMLMPIKVRGGRENAVEIKIENQEYIAVPRGVNELGNVVVMPEYLKAPVRKGQAIGRVGFYNGKELVCETDIITKEAVDSLSFTYILKKSLLDMLK